MMAASRSSNSGNSPVRLNVRTKMKSPSSAALHDSSELDGSLTPALTQAERDFENNIEELFQNIGLNRTRNSITNDDKKNDSTSDSKENEKSNKNNNNNNNQQNYAPSVSSISTMTSDSYNYGDSMNDKDFENDNSNVMSPFDTFSPLLSSDNLKINMHNSNNNSNNNNNDNNGNNDNNRNDNDFEDGLLDLSMSMKHTYNETMNRYINIDKSNDSDGNESIQSRSQSQSQSQLSLPSQLSESSLSTHSAKTKTLLKNKFSRNKNNSNHINNNHTIIDNNNNNNKINSVINSSHTPNAANISSKQKIRALLLNQRQSSNNILQSNRNNDNDNSSNNNNNNNNSFMKRSFTQRRLFSKIPLSKPPPPPPKMKPPKPPSIDRNMPNDSFKFLHTKTQSNTILIDKNNKSKHNEDGTRTARNSLSLSAEDKKPLFNTLSSDEQNAIDAINTIDPNMSMVSPEKIHSNHIRTESLPTNTKMNRHDNNNDNNNNNNDATHSQLGLPKPITPRSTQNKTFKHSHSVLNLSNALSYDQANNTRDADKINAKNGRNKSSKSVTRRYSDDDNELSPNKKNGNHKTKSGQVTDDYIRKHGRPRAMTHSVMSAAVDGSDLYTKSPQSKQAQMVDKYYKNRATVLQKLSQGKSKKEVLAKLEISIRRVEERLKHYVKQMVNQESEAKRYAKLMETELKEWDKRANWELSSLCRSYYQNLQLLLKLRIDITNLYCECFSNKFKELSKVYERVKKDVRRRSYTLDDLILSVEAAMMTTSNIRLPKTIHGLRTSEKEMTKMIKELQSKYEELKLDVTKPMTKEDRTKHLLTLLIQILDTSNHNIAKMNVELKKHLSKYDGLPYFHPIETGFQTPFEQILFDPRFEESKLIKKWLSLIESNINNSNNNGGSKSDGMTIRTISTFIHKLTEKLLQSCDLVEGKPYYQKSFWDATHLMICRAILPRIRNVINSILDRNETAKENDRIYAKRLTWMCILTQEQLGIDKEYLYYFKPQKLLSPQSQTIVEGESENTSNDGNSDNEKVKSKSQSNSQSNPNSPVKMKDKKNKKVKFNPNTIKVGSSDMVAYYEPIAQLKSIDSSVVPQDSFVLLIETIHNIQKCAINYYKMNREHDKHRQLNKNENENDNDRFVSMTTHEMKQNMHSKSSNNDNNDNENENGNNDNDNDNNNNNGNENDSNGNLGKKESKKESDNIVITADSLMPIIVYCVVQSGVEHWHRWISMMENFYPKSVLNFGQAGFCFSSLTACVSYIMEQKPSNFGIDDDVENQ